MSTGYFITLEGIEGVGKSTVIAFVSEFLTQHNIEHIVTREPGGTGVGEKIRDILLVEDQESMHAETECMLMFAARAQHLHEVVRPTLAAGTTVLCDRFTDATYAYQGGGRGVDLGVIEFLENWTHPDMQPDLTLLLDADIHTALTRARERGHLDRIEAESDNFFERVRQAYINRVQQFPERFQTIDANQELTAVKKQLENIMQSWLEKHVNDN